MSSFSEPEFSKKVLIVDDSHSFSKLIGFKLKKKLNMESILSFSFEDSKKVLSEQKENIFATILDLNLPDAPGYEHIEYFLKNKIPSIILTGEFSDEIRDKVFNNMKIVDYALKTRKEDLDYLLSLLTRLQKNKTIKIIVADDSIIYRKIITDLLETHLYKVLIAKNGYECLNLLNENPDTKMILTDYDMPGMDGFTLTSTIREKYSKDQISILGVSSSETKNISSRFIKFGVNDFIGKPFSKEEFYCRINMNIDIMENFQKMRDLANKDFLTKLNNRRSFFDEVPPFFMMGKNWISVAMIDIDFFKKINDTYGHDAGDQSLVFLANEMIEYMGESGMLARFGGEEFAVVLSHLSKDSAYDFFDTFREKISKLKIRTMDKEFQFTISIGLLVIPSEKKTVEECLSLADSLLYQAKMEGKNRVIPKIFDE